MRRFRACCFITVGLRGGTTYRRVDGSAVRSRSESFFRSETERRVPLGDKRKRCGKKKKNASYLKQNKKKKKNTPLIRVFVRCLFRRRRRPRRGGGGGM